MSDTDLLSMKHDYESKLVNYMSHVNSEQGFESADSAGSGSGSPTFNKNNVGRGLTPSKSEAVPTSFPENFG